MLLSLSRDSGIEKEVLDSEDRGLYIVNTEMWKMRGMSDEPVKIRACYNKQGHFIGDEKTAKFICGKRCIAPEVSSPEHSVCSIGYSAKDGKYYGWSHRAIYGFKIGDTVKEGDCGYDPKRGAWTAETDADARLMAQKFAESVSSTRLVSEAADAKVLNYMYNSPRTAKMKSGDKTLLLNKGDLFRLSMFKGFPCVVKDGVIYIIKSDSVKVLKSRSEILKPQKSQVALTKAFDVLGHDFTEYVKSEAVKLAGAENVKSGFNDGYAYAYFPMRSPTGEVHCALSVNSNTVSARIFKSVSQDLKGWDFFPKLQNAIKRVAVKIAEKHDLDIGKFQPGKMTVGNIRMPWGGSYSGVVLSYYARINILGD